MPELTNEELMYASAEDQAFFAKCIEGLPDRRGFLGNYLDKYGVEIPYSSGAHIVRHFREVVEIVKPEHILEIGFNLGYSAAMWLNLSKAYVTSMEISDKQETVAAHRLLINRFPSRFKLLLDPHSTLVRLKFTADLLFIDGAHDELSVTVDINLAQNLKIPFLLFDDWYPRFGPGVQAAVNKFDLELVKDMDNLKLMTWKKEIRSTH